MVEKEIKSVIKNKPDLLKTQSTISPGVSITPVENMTLQTSYIMESSKHSVNAELIYNMTRQNSISLKYQYLMNRDKADKEADYDARIASIMVLSKF